MKYYNSFVTFSSLFNQSNALSLKPLSEKTLNDNIPSPPMPHAEGIKKAPSKPLKATKPSTMAHSEEVEMSAEKFEDLKENFHRQILSLDF